MSQPSFDLDETFDDGGSPTLTVAELGVAINAALKRGFFDGVWVRGEIQGWREGPNGHAYFSLVDDSGESKATVSIQFFANTRMKLRPHLAKHRLRLGDGMKVRVHGFLDYYAAGGRLGLKVDGMDFRYTLGEIALARDELVRRLVAEGLYDANRQRPLPMVPLRIGVVTSVGSAAWHDFTHELEASGLQFRLVVADTRVQGDDAVRMITRAIEQLSIAALSQPLGSGQPPGQRPRSRLDAIVIVRGGGSRSDLAAFDAEPVARAIAGAPVPVLTGLGHEIDRSVADEVAHLSLKTPTACAGALIERVVAYRDQVESTWARIGTLASTRLDRHERRVNDLASRAAVSTTSATRLAAERLERFTMRLPTAARRVLADDAAVVERCAGRVGSEAKRHLAVAGLRLDVAEGRTRALDPAATLARGWTITRTTEGRLVRSPADVAPGDHLVTVTANGEIASVVEPNGVAGRDRGLR